MWWLKTVLIKKISSNRLAVPVPGWVSPAVCEVLGIEFNCASQFITVLVKADLSVENQYRNVSYIWQPSLLSGKLEIQ